MIVFKISGCALVFLSCTLLGYTLKNKTMIRVSNLENMISCINVFKNEIRISLRDIQSASLKVLGVAKGTNFYLFNKLAHDQKNVDGQTMSELWRDAVSSVVAESNYSKEDIDVFMRFGDVLGSGDARSQIDNLEIFETELTRMLDDARKCVSNKGVLFGKIGIYIGAITVILLI